MKNIFRFLMAVAVLFTASCAKEDISSSIAGGEVEVTFTANLPEFGTRAYGDGTQVNKLRYYVYDNNGTLLEGLSNTTTGVNIEVGKTTTVNLVLIKGMTYNILFWADSNNGYYTIENGVVSLANIDSINANDESRDAFYAAVKGFNPANATAENTKIDLYRPFAQLNAKVTNMDEVNKSIKVESTTISTKIYTTFNPFAENENEVVGGLTDEPVTFTETKMDDADIAAGHISMNYLLAPAGGCVADVTFTFNNDKHVAISGTTYTNVPLKANYRTNIIGALLTNSTDFTVEIKPAFDEQYLEPEALFKAAVLGGEVTLTEDVVLTQPLVVVSDMTINLNGKTISGEIHKSVGAIIKNEGTLTIKGGTISSTAENGGSAVLNNGILVVEDATLNGAPNADGDWPSYTVNNTGKMTISNTKITSYHGAVASYGDNAVVTLNDSEIDMSGIPGFTSHGMYTYNNGKIVVNGGTYANKATDQASSGASVINGAIEVNAGTFSGRIENYYGTPVLKGGNYSVKPNANFIAAGYEAIEKDGRYYVVAEGATVVANKDEIKDALNAAITAGKTNVIIDAGGANIGDLSYGLSSSKIPTGTTVTLCNANVVGSSYGNGVNGTVIFENCTFNNPNGAYSIHFDNGSGDVKFKNCKLYGWNSFGSSLNSVSFEGCSLNGNGTYALIRSYVALSLTDCVINTTNADATDVYSEGVEAVNGATLTETNVVYVIDDKATLGNILSNGADNLSIILDAGSYTIPDSAQGKTLTFEGNGDVEIISENDGAAEGNCDYCFRGSKVTFKNITITTTGTYFPGYANMEGTFENCTINGVYTTYMSSSFKNCTFNVSGDLYNLWTWGAENVTLDGCTFNCDGKAVLLYGGADTQLKVNNCVFNDNGGLTDLKAAIEIGSGYGKSYELIVNNATVNGFEINDKGINTGTTLWANKNSMGQDKLNVVVDGVDVY